MLWFNPASLFRTLFLVKVFLPSGFYPLINCDIELGHQRLKKGFNLFNVNHVLRILPNV